MAAGFTATDILDVLGSALADLGILSSPTAWYDSFTDTAGSEVRIVAKTRGTGTRNTIYSAFFVSSDELWYAHYYNWDIATHESKGAPYYDHANTYEHPDDNTTSKTSYYARLALMNNSSDNTISAITSAEGNMGFIHIKSPSESRVYGTALDSATLDPNVPTFDDVGPTGWIGMNIPGGFQGTTTSRPMMYAGALHVLKADLLFGFGDQSTTASDYNVKNTWNGAVNSGNIDLGALSLDVFNYAPPYATGTRVDGVAAVGYRFVYRAPLFGGLYTDTHTGDLGVLYSTDPSFTPSYGDTIVVTAGVEEYYLLKVNEPATSTIEYSNEWSAMAVRTV